MYDIFTYHLCEVESFDKLGDDVIFDINILPNRAHDLLSHQGIAKELASLLNIKYNDPTPKYKVPHSTPSGRSGQAGLKIDVQSDKCRRYMGRIVRNVKVGPSPDWVKNHLESIGQRSINNAVDGANITMFDCGQPIHCFDLDKVHGALIIRMAREGEEITTLDNKVVMLKTTDLVITDEENVLAIAGVKGGKIAEVDENTKNIIIEVANFDPISVRKTGRGANIFTDALKRFENDLSPTLCDFAIMEMSGLFVEYGFTDFEDIVDIYPEKQEERKLTFRTEKISKMLGLGIKENEIEDILNRYNFKFKNNSGVFVMDIPPMRLDLEIEEDMAEEIGRILGYDKVINKIPEINFKPKVSDTYAKISLARNKLLSTGYSEVMTYTFSNNGEVEVMQSASDKKFLRTNLSDGLKESLKLNKLNLPLLDLKEVKIFEIGTIFKKGKEEIYIAYNEKPARSENHSGGDKIIEKSLEEFCKASPEFNSESTNIFLLENFSARASRAAQGFHNQTPASQKFAMWSSYPFIARDISVWVPEEIESVEVKNLIKENAGELVVVGPELFDEFKKDGKTSYAFRTVFQSFERTLTDTEINQIMTNISNKIKDKKTNSHGWQVR
jgi:phenylalanyl-tRNA synthetase beta chain